jgi:hypothetical protein
LSHAIGVADDYVDSAGRLDPEKKANEGIEEEAACNNFAPGIDDAEYADGPPVRNLASGAVVQNLVRMLGVASFGDEPTPSSSAPGVATNRREAGRAGRLGSA